MAFTVNNVTVTNFAPTNNSTACFNVVWKHTRAMKKAGWKVLASSDGTTKTVSTDPELDEWNSGTVVTTNAGGTGTVGVGAVTNNYRSTITDLTGIVAADKGRFLRITSGGSNVGWHQIEEVLSSTSVRIDARSKTITPESVSITWSIIDNFQENYPTALNATAAWILMRGPSIIRIPITTAAAPGSTGLLFQRGENVVQATTLAEGEIIGYVFAGSAGYLVIKPRVVGSGAGPYGWGTGNLITGDSTGANVSQDGTTLEYRHECVFWRASANEQSGSVFMGYFDPVADSADMFSTKSSSVGATATIAPGGGGTGNAFPAFGWVHHGSSTAGGHLIFDNVAGTRNMGNFHSLCADNIEEPGYSADGSWLMIYCNANNIANGGCTGNGFMACENTEDGELHPYVTYVSSGAGTIYDGARTGVSSVIESASSNNFQLSQFTGTPGGRSYFKGWRRRGLTSGDQFQNFEVGYLSLVQSVVSHPTGFNVTNPDIIATALVPTKARSPISILSVQLSRKCRKGDLKWMFVVSQTGGWGDLYDSKIFLQLSNATSPIVAGPWDGITTPAFINT